MPKNQKRKRKRPSDAVVPEAEEKATPAKKKARRSKNGSGKTEKTEKAEKIEEPKKKLHKKLLKSAEKLKKERYKERSPRKKRKFPQRKRLLGKRKKKYNKRRRTKCLRQIMCRVLERALVEGPKIPLIYHLFTSRDSMGTPRALLSEVLRQLKISDYVKNSHFLTDAHMLSLHQFTTVFTIEKDEPDERLWLKYWPIYDRDAATVYIDNLPEGCNEAKLMRLANCFGTVVEMRIGKKGPRMIRPRHHPKKKHHNPNAPVHRHIHRIPPKPKPLIDIGSRPLQFGFVRFVDMDSASRMIQEYIVNDPSRLYQKLEEARQREEDLFGDDFLDQGLGDMENLGEPIAPRPFPRFKPFFELSMSKLLLEIRYLKARRKRRTYPMWRRLRKLNRRLKLMEEYENTCLRKAGFLPPRRKKRKPRRLIPPPPREEELSEHDSDTDALDQDYPEDPRHPQDFEDPDQPGPSGPVVCPMQRERSLSVSSDSSADSAENGQEEEREEEEDLQEEGEEENLEEVGPVRERKPKRKRANRKPKKKKKGEKRLTEIEEIRLKVKRKRRKMKRKLREDRARRRKWREERLLKRRRDHPSRKTPKFILGRSVRKYFEKVQVLSLHRYLELKAEYLGMIQKERERIRDEVQAPPAPDDVPDLDL